MLNLALLIDLINKISMPKSLILLFSIILLTTFSCKQTKSTMKSGTDNSFQVNDDIFALNVIG